MADDGEHGWPGELPEVDGEPAGGALLGCAKALGVSLMLGVIAVGVVALVAGGLLGSAAGVADRFADGLGDDRTGVDRRDGRVGPGDGADSRRLPVVADPAEALADRAVLAVVSEAFAGSQIVGVTLCDRAVVDDGRSIEDGCDLNEFATFAVPRSGPVVVPYEVRRVVTIGSEAIDCAESPGRCALLLADMDDYRRSGFAVLSFDPVPPVDVVPSGGPRPTGGLTATATPAGPIADGESLTVSASGFVPGEPLQVSVCRADLAPLVPTEACAELHDINWYLGGRFADATRDLDLWAARWHADAAGRATATHPVAASFRPFGSGMGDVSTGDGPLVDCTVRAGACAVVVAAAADPTRAAVLPYEVAED